MILSFITETVENQESLQSPLSFFLFFSFLNRFLYSKYNKHADIPRLYRRRVPLPNFSGGHNPPLKPGGALEPSPGDIMIAAMKEAILVANAEGILLVEQDIKEYLKLLGTLSYDGMPSM